MSEGWSLVIFKARTFFKLYGNSILIAELDTSGFRFLIIFFTLSLLLSVPLIAHVWNILMSDEFPSGGDPADHTLFILKILKTGNPLISYTQFPSFENQSNGQVTYYPSLFHLMVSGPAAIMEQAGIPAVNAAVGGMITIVLCSYLIGIFGYGLLIRKFFHDIILSVQRAETSSSLQGVIFLSLMLLGMAIFLYSTAPILKTLRDGGYGEILAMWSMLPIYIYTLLTKRFILGGIIFGLIASTHNLSILLTVLVSLSYFVSLVVRRDFKLLKKVWLLIAVAALASFPAFVFFYYPTLLAAFNQETGLSGATAFWSRSDIATQIGPFLYYYGTLSALGLLFINYRVTSMLVVWIVLYLLPFSFNLFFLERFAREFAIPFAIVSALFSISAIYIFVAKWFTKLLARIRRNRPAETNSVFARQVIIVVSLTIIIIPLYYAVFSNLFDSYTDPRQLDYYSPSFEAANNFILEKSNNPGESAVVLYGINPWLKPVVFDRFDVLEVETQEFESSLSQTDRQINSELRSLIEEPQGTQADTILKKYNIEYLFFSDLMQGRWYPDSQRQLVNTIANFEENHDKNKYQLEGQWRGNESELLQVYSVTLDPT